MEFIFLFLILISFLVATGGFIWGILFLVKDVPQKGQNLPLWLIMFIFFGIPALGLYLLLTERVKWGIFWLIGVPFIFGIFGLGLVIFIA